MSNKTAPQFVHRRNRDGSYDSICPLCAATAASATIEANLVPGELVHTCDSYLLETRRKLLAQQPQARPEPRPVAET
jgi:hypothetical protein